MKRSIIIGLVAVVIVGVGGYFIFARNNSAPTNNSTTSSTSQQAAATITYSGSGFSPSTTTVKSGDTVAIKNTSSSDMQLASNPHPVHTDDSDLNVGVVGAGQTKTFTVTKKGTFGFHNHLNPSDTATITIE